jgi:hypothetical protein
MQGRKRKEGWLMAVVSLKNVEVARVNSKGNGVQVVERWQVKGADRSQRYTVWFDEPHNLREGDRIDVSGFLSVAVEPWTDRDGNVRHSARVSLNSPRMDRDQAVQTAPVMPPHTGDVPF